MIANLGCGDDIQGDAVNIDLRPRPGVHIVADVRDVEKIGIGQYDGFRARHILEHFSYRKTVEVLQDWRKLLKEGGWYDIHVPNGRWQVEAVVNGEILWEDFVYFAYGEQNYPGNFHYTSFSQDSLAQALEDAGYSSVHVQPNHQVLIAQGGR